MPHHFSQSGWDQAKEHLSQGLIDFAKEYGRLEALGRLPLDFKFPCYSEVLKRDIAPALAPEITANPLLTPLHYFRDHRYEQMIYEVLEEYYLKHKIYLTVLLVHKTGDQMPGGDFFKACEYLRRRKITDKVAFWDEEVKRVVELFSRGTVRTSKQEKTYAATSI